MTWLFILLAMTVIALVAGVVTGRIAGSMAPPTTSLPFRGLPTGTVVAGDLEALRFDAALRGYRMDEVDQVLDRLADELRRRDDEIAALRTSLAMHEAADSVRPAEPEVDQAGLPFGPAYAPPAGGYELGSWADPGQG